MRAYCDSAVDILMDAARNFICDDERLDRAADELGEFIAAFGIFAAGFALGRAQRAVDDIRGLNDRVLRLEQYDDDEPARDAADGDPFDDDDYEPADYWKPKGWKPIDP